MAFLNLLIQFSVLITFCVYTTNEVLLDCSQLRKGQFMCPDPQINHIDSKTQQPIDCNRDNKAKVWCIAADGIICEDTNNASFLGEIPCKWTCVLILNNIKYTYTVQIQLI